MLTCPPSRINLTSADLAGFEQRLAERQAARRDATNIRLGPGPAKQTRYGYVPANANVGRHRADSCSSQATICTEGDDPTIHSNAATPAQRFDLSRTLDGARTSLSPSDLPERPPAQTRPPAASSAATRSPARPPPSPRFPIHEDPPFVQGFIEYQHQAQYRQRRRERLIEAQARAPPARAQRLQPPRGPPQEPDPSTQAWVNPSLDPGAPVFVPRTRFGSTASTSADSGDGGVRINDRPVRIDGTHSTVNLRIRSSFERNTQQSSRSTDGQTTISDNLLPNVPQADVQPRRRSRTNDQNAALQRPLLGFDRYPAIRPPTAVASTRRNSGSQRPVVFPRRRSSRQHLVEYERLRQTQEGRQQNRPTHLTVPQNDGLRSVSPAVSPSSRSTPNLLQPPAIPQVHTRSSSFTWNQDAAPVIRPRPVQRSAKQTRVVSQPSTLIDENILHRESPLDRLIEAFSEMPARPRSVGRSFERPPGTRARPSLLNGDPFRVDSSDELMNDERIGSHFTVSPRLGFTPARPVAEGGLSASVSSKSPTAQTPHRRNTTIEDAVAVALALPPPDVPSSPALGSSPTLPSTPPLRTAPSSPLSPPGGSASAGKSQFTTGSLTPSTQSLAAAVTPKVPVYNDSKPPGTQPQTPADIARASSRRARGRSNTASTYQSAVTSIQPSPTQAAPERHPHRHTYPSATAQPSQQVTIGLTPVRAAAVVESDSTARRQSVTARLDQRSSGSAENEIEGSIQGLEQDRRTWMRRREDGTLDVTPPREGRFERYLS